ncbi:FkbM family methyltransferase [Sinorhizobium meliloti]|uniref:FkbM family methyltransferase n=1 Tax=Rhizobium meliloti TaxID=382 RepID=UPI0023808FF7|nr:FkbM family methyltransferase [Sinorhizobium meliloti]MDE3796997.1 FkbM family methyltransferase [Sinorhizobium meliloti]
MNIARLFGLKANKKKPSWLPSMLNLESLELLMEARIRHETSGIPDRDRRRKAERRARKAITAALEAVVLEIVAREKPSLVLEIGAHRAEFSRQAKLRSPDSSCIAFEGHPKVFERFAEEVKSASVDYRHLCISDARKELDFLVPVYMEQEMDNMGSIMPYNENLALENSKHETYKVAADTLDGFLGRDAKKSKLIWIDVEGAAGVILQGAKKSLANCVAVYLEVETETRWEGQSSLDTDIHDILTKRGFVPVLRDVQRMRWQYNVLYVNEALAKKQYLLNLGRQYMTDSGPK